MYRDSLLLPKTNLPMKPNFVQIEQETQKKWEGLYKAIQKDRSFATRQIVHDGPPYANGEIHFGHVINKIIKDIIVRFLTMKGYNSAFIPGWDCHGLPIEHQTREKINNITDPVLIRKACQETAERFIDIQKKQFQRLGILADWENPYLTMSTEYEKNVLIILKTLVNKYLIYRKLRPIAWCPNDQTALADAELEYKDITSNSIYVEFQSNTEQKEFNGNKYSFIAWTTTPWSLPGNTALAVNSDLDYSLISVETTTGNKNIICASDRIKDVIAPYNVYNVIAVFKGEKLTGSRYQHPIVSGKECVVVAADWVDVKVGTGIVHIAPAHGMDDYNTAIKEEIPVFCPIDSQGKFDKIHDLLDGQFATSKKTIDLIYSILGDRIWKKEEITHSYPHCWRCHQPTITRATPQWFLDVEKIRQDSLDWIKQIEWVPASLQNRIESMVEKRSDWCISRQRVWGTPIPAVSCKNCENILLNDATFNLHKEKGSNWWLDNKSECPKGLFSCPECNNDEFKINKDILDVWFEAGSSFLTVLNNQKVICCEGSDQHRGWFQSSILLSVAFQDKLPFNTVITHGWVVDENGKKFSKSKGAPPISKILDQFGTDVVRLFVTSCDYTEDYKIIDRKLIDTRDVHHKIRNTLRFILGNLNDFNHQIQKQDINSFEHILDNWILARLNDLIRSVTTAYENYNLVQVYHLLNRFCIVELSNIYFDIIKDRLYADKIESESGMSCRWVLVNIYKVLVRLLAPIIPYTAEEFWSYISNQSIFLEEFPKINPKFDDNDVDKSLWKILFDFREQINAKIEVLRINQEIKQNQEVSVTICKNNNTLFKNFTETLRELCNLSEVILLDKTSSEIIAKRTTHPKCDRCRRYISDVRNGLCERCQPFRID